ncbi:MAG: response regulator transcription factor [Chloroflexi bacterium]|nr:response regulator transcription factor [Chloroflexota bacterium]MBI4300615.1 response regulator transcription factor [Chloroflexota bacterium]
MANLRVLIADDHVVVRAGIRLLLDSQEDIEVVGEAKDGVEAVARTRELAPDIVLMDVAMAGLTGLEATREIRQANPDTRVLMLTMHDDEEYFFQAVSLGASGYILKEASPDEVISALRIVSRGGVAFHPSLGRKLLDDYLHRVEAGEESTSYRLLTEREREILRMTAEGRSARETGGILGLSPRTVERHRANLMEKLGLHNRSEVVQYAIRKGLISTHS